MQLKSITCTVGRTINMGNFNSLRIEWSETVDMDDATEKRSDVREALIQEVLAQLELLEKAARRR